MKEQFKKAISVMLTFVIVLALGTIAFASNYKITIQNATIGQTYSAYKIFDATYNEDGGVSYTISTGSALYESIAALTDVFDLEAAVTDASTFYVTVKYGVTDAQVIAAIESLDIENLVSASASTTATDTTLTLDVGDAGYYYITSTTGALVSVTTAAPAASIVDKNEMAGEDFRKYIIDENGNAIQYGDAAMGDRLNFDISSSVPRYEGGDTVYEYQFTDTLSDTGMEIEITVDEGHIITRDDSYGTTHYWADEELINQFVKFADSNGNTYTLSEVACNYTLEFTDVFYDKEAGCYVCNGFVLTYYTYEDETLSATRYPTDLTINITYTAYVTDNANHFESNTAVLDYWVMGPNGPEPGTNSGASSTDYVYDWALKILKIDGEDFTPLEGATFTLYGTSLIDVIVRADYTYTLITQAEMEPGVTYYYLTADGRWITTAPTSATRSQYDPVNPGPYIQSTETYESKTAGPSFTVEGTTNRDGIVIFDGLTEGTYTITEIVAPDGYNLLDGSITITVSFDSEKGMFYVDSVFGLMENLTFDVNNEMEIIVLNNTGAMLPGTGGMGTYLFYIIGAVLICSAAVVLVMRRRRTNAEA